jgi:hypothetical protein
MVGIIYNNRKKLSRSLFVRFYKLYSSIIYSVQVCGYHHSNKVLLQKIKFEVRFEPIDFCIYTIELCFIYNWHIKKEKNLLEVIEIVLINMEDIQNIDKKY